MGKDLLDPVGIFAGSKDVGDEFDGGTSGVSIRDNSKTTQKEIPVVYGEVRVGGNLVYITTTGADNNQLWVVQTLSEGECDSITQDGGVDQVFLDDKLWNEYGGNVNYYFHAGTGVQTVDTNLNSASAEWTDTLRFLSYMVFHCTWNEDYFQSMPDFQTVLKGVKLYDFRDLTTVWSNNPVLCLYDFMTNVRYGAGLDSAKFDIPSWVAAANYCDEKSFTYNNVLAKNMPIGKVIDEFRAHFRGRMNWFDGKFSLKYADLNYEPVAMNLTDDHLAEARDGTLAVSVAEPSTFVLPDAVSIKWRDPDNAFVEDDLQIGDQTGVVKKINMLGCTNREMAGTLGVYHLERAILNRTLSATLRMDAIRLEPWDIVVATWSDLAIADQYLRVQDITVGKDGVIRAKFAYEALALYDDVFNLVVADVYQCTLPDPSSIPGQVTDVVLSEEIYDYRLQSYTRLLVTATAPEHEYFSGVNVWKSFDDIDYEFLSFVEGAAGGSIDFSLDPVEEGTTYYLIMTSVSWHGPEQTLAQGYKASRTILGLEALPASLAEIFAIANDNTVSVYGQKLSDPDVEVYEFRLGGWTGGIFLASLRSPNLNLQGVKPGDHLFYANTFSTNGFYGEFPRSASTTLIDPPKGWTVQATYVNYYSLVGNGGFDADASLWTAVNATLASVAGGQDGNCLQLTYVSGSFQDAYQSMGVFEEVVTIDWEVWVKSGTSGNEAFQVLLWNFTDSAYVGAGSAYASTTTGSWVKHSGSVTLVAADLGDELRLYLRKNTATAGTMLFDEVFAEVAEEHRNTEYTKYFGEDYLKCSHDGAIAGDSYVFLHDASFTYVASQRWQPFLNIDGLNSIQLHLNRDGSPSGNIKAYIYDDNGGEPDSLLATSDDVDVTGIGTGDDWVTFTFSTPPELTKNTVYHIVIDGNDFTGSNGNTIAWKYDSNGAWGEGRLYRTNGTWTEEAAEDHAFIADQYTGRYTSREYDRGASGTYLVYVLADTVVTGAGTTWGDVIPSPDTWGDIGIEFRTWQEIFALEEAPQINVKMYWGDISGSLTNSVEKMEILSTIATGRYFQFEITIRDPSESVEVLVENYIAKFCQ